MTVDIALAALTLGFALYVDDGVRLESDRDSRLRRARRARPLYP